jgi:hypothetical protein
MPLTLRARFRTSVFSDAETVAKSVIPRMKKIRFHNESYDLTYSARETAYPTIFSEISLEMALQGPIYSYYS